MNSDQTSPFEILPKQSSNMPHVVWAEESTTSLGFEIGPSYDDVPTTSQRRSNVQLPGNPACQN